MKDDTRLLTPTEEPLAARRPRSRLKLIVWVVVLAILAFAAFNLPLPMFYAYEPGPVRDVEKLVTVSGERTYSSEGSLYLTTVSIDLEVTFAEWVGASFNDEIEVVSRQSVTGGVSFEEVEQQQKAQMEQSKQQARDVALSEFERFGKPDGDGAEIVDTLKGSPAEGTLRAKDVIVAVDGSPIDTTCDAVNAIASHDPGDEVELTIERAGERRTIRLETAEDPAEPGTPLVGVFMTTANYDYNPGIDVRFKTGNIAGPSAGLMFTLALYDQLTPDDLTHGREIAGTGTIGCGGEVGPIGGIRQKVAGAEAQGARIFLTPTANVADARVVAEGIEIVPVATFDDALRYLEGLR